MLAPRITIEFNGDMDLYQLLATSYSVTNPAGERLFRSRPYPDVQFLHTDEATANEHASRLQAYLDDCYSVKARKDKRGAEEEEQIETEMSVDTTNAIWNL